MKPRCAPLSTKVTKELRRRFVGEIRNYDCPLFHRAAEEHLNEGSEWSPTSRTFSASWTPSSAVCRVSRRGKHFVSRSQRRAAPKRNLERSESNRLHLVENAFGKSARSPGSVLRQGNAGDMRSDKTVFHEVGKSSATWRNNHLERYIFEVLRLRSPRQSRIDLDAIS